MAAIRTKQLKKGAKALVQAEENKAVVVALREIAAGYIKPDYPEEEGSETA
jgi:DNA-directed RNA polymerase omega subunit